MADIFVSYARADKEMVRRIVALLEAQGWSVWWDTRIPGGQRWDEVIEREIKVARCVVVVWTPQSFDREWVHLEAHHGRSRGILAPILIGVAQPPFAFSLIHARQLTGWDGTSSTPAAVQFLSDVRHKVDRNSPAVSSLADTIREWMVAEGGIKVDAKIVHGAPDGFFKPGAGKTEWFNDIDVGPEMVVVPSGTFTMGSIDDPQEMPPHTVTIKAPFAAGRFAVTFAEWDAAGLPHKPDDEGWGRGRRPVINVSWEDAKAYTRWLSETTGKTYRLLSEAEWEYCCRSGTITRYALGDWFHMKKGYAQFSEDSWGSAKRTAEVGKFPPNEWGLYDMHGNVWEWCEDAYYITYHGAPQDGSVWTGGDLSQRFVRGERVVRGGSWGDYPGVLRSSKRHGGPLGVRSNGAGFRVARTLTLGNDAAVDGGRAAGRGSARQRGSAEIRLKAAASYRSQGQAVLEGGDCDQAIVALTSAIENNPQNANTYWRRGLAYSEKGDHTRAVADFSKVIEIDPRHAASYWSRGQTHLEKRYYDRAIADFSRAIEIDPNYAGFHWSRGFAYKAMADYARAIADFTKAIEVDPNYEAAYLGRGRAYYLTHDFDRAIADFNKAVEIDPNPKHGDVYFSRGLALRDKGDHTGAVADFTGAIGTNSRHLNVHYNRGLTYEALGRFPEAIRDFREALGNNPNDEASREALRRLAGLP